MKVPPSSCPAYKRVVSLGLSVALLMLMVPFTVARGSGAASRVAGPTLSSTRQRQRSASRAARAMAAGSMSTPTRTSGLNVASSRGRAFFFLSSCPLCDLDSPHVHHHRVHYYTDTLDMGHGRCKQFGEGD